MFLFINDKNHPVLYVLFMLKKGRLTKKILTFAKKRLGAFCNYNTFKEKFL